MTAPPESLPVSLSDRLGYLLGRAHLANRLATEKALAPLRLSGKELGALSILVEEGPVSQQRLGERQGVDRTTMVAVVDELESSGFVERRRDPRDRRAYSLQATPNGRRVLQRAAEATEQAEDEFLARLSAADRRRLKELLLALVERSARST